MYGGPANQIRNTMARMNTQAVFGTWREWGRAKRCVFRVSHVLGHLFVLLKRD